jgi:hypothetical protein
MIKWNSKNNSETENGVDTNLMISSNNNIHSTTDRMTHHYGIPLCIDRTIYLKTGTMNIRAWQFPSNNNFKYLMMII